MRKEPACLPTLLPILLMNGVGHSKLDDKRNPRIPPHNLTELCNAILAKIETPKLSSRDLLQWCKGPDFPQGGTILNGSDLAQMYESGVGTIKVRGEAKIEQSSERHGRMRRTMIVVTSLPFMIGPEFFTKEVAQLVRDGEIDGISDLSDETDRNGIRVEIELKRDANPEEILAELMRRTPLQTEVPVKMLVMVKRLRKHHEDIFAPRIVNLAELIQHYVDYQFDVVARRIRDHLSNMYLLLPQTRELAESRIVDNIISYFGNGDHSVRRISRVLGISEDMAKAVTIYYSAGDQLEERLTQAQRRLGYFASPQEAAAHYERILRDNSEILEIVKSQVVTLRDKYGDSRLTNIISV